MPQAPSMRCHSAVISMKAWIKRLRANKGIEPSADEIDSRIRRNWPTMRQDEREWVFQNSN